MGQLETMISDLAEVASGAWETKSGSVSPENAVTTAFTSAIDTYVSSYHSACRTLSVTRGKKFSDLSQDLRRQIVFGLSEESLEDRRNFEERFRRSELEGHYQQFLIGDHTRWGKYVTALQAVDRWMVFTNLSPMLQVKLPYHRGCRETQPENLQLQARFAQKLGILESGQTFGDLEKRDRMMVDVGKRDNAYALKRLQEQHPETILASLKAIWNGYAAHLLYQGHPCNYRNIPTRYGEAIKSTVEIKFQEGREDDVNSLTVNEALEARSEERRVGKECRSRWSPYH